MTYLNVVEPYSKVNSICRVSESSNIVTSILRILSGTVMIENVTKNKLLDLRKFCNKPPQISNSCYIEHFSGINSHRIAGIFYKALSDDISINDYNTFSKKVIHSNAGFFKTLYNEILYCIWNKHTGKDTNSFIHIYRILEHISYAFPFLYISKTKDFIGSYNKFKSFFNSQSGDKKSELSFFKSFLSLSLKDDAEFSPLLSREMIFNLIGEDEHKKNYLNVIKKHIDNDLIISSSLIDYSLVINWSTIPQLIINLRNKYFHYNNSQADNITSDEIIDSDQFFMNLNSNFIKWFTILFIIILNTLYDKLM